MSRVNSRTAESDALPAKSISRTVMMFAPSTATGLSVTQLPPTRYSIRLPDSLGVTVNSPSLVYLSSTTLPVSFAKAIVGASGAVVSNVKDTSSVKVLPALSFATTFHVYSSSANG